MSGASHRFQRHATMSAAERCDRLRQLWFAWQGRAGLSRTAALAQLGWTGSSKQPRWSSQGNIPDEWAHRMARQIGTTLDQITAA